MVVTPLQVLCTAQVAVESLIGPETHTMQGILKVSMPSSFTPHKVDEQGFALILGKNSSKWAVGSTKVPTSTTSKPKSILKGVCEFLKAHKVESESTKAASLCAKTPSGGYVCVLAKLSKDGTSVSIDVKCLAASKNESQSCVDAIVQALADLKL